MKNILVATDFSNNAYCALFYATQLLASKKCTFYLLNTYSELTPLKRNILPGFGGKKLLKQLETESMERLTSTSHKIVLDKENSNHTFKTIPQKGELVKVMKANDIVEMGGRSVARVLRMGKLKTPDEWTEMTVSEIEFDIELPAAVFTLSNLRNPRQ